jgi:peptidyl-prolyl cis-trans isomerase SurA
LNFYGFLTGVYNKVIQGIFMRKFSIPAAILFSLILVFKSAFCAVLLDRVVATVNDEVITWSELMSVIAIEGRDYLSDLSDEERGKRLQELERPFLNSLVEMKLQLQQAHRMGLDVSASEVDSAIEDIKQKYEVSEETLINSLQSEGLSMRDYRNRLGEQILLQKVINQAVRINVVVSDLDIEEYYEENRDKFGSEEVKLKIRQIFFTMADYSSERDVIESRAGEVVHRLKQGEDFGELARQYSEDPSGKFGGDLGFVELGSLLKEVEDVALSLKPGEVSEPFWSSAGLHIIKLEDKIEGGGIAEARQKIKEILFKKAFEESYHEWRTGLRENAYIEISL